MRVCVCVTEREVCECVYDSVYVSVVEDVSTVTHVEIMIQKKMSLQKKNYKKINIIMCFR